jgi:hypothetical protein
MDIEAVSQYRMKTILSCACGTIWSLSNFGRCMNTPRLLRVNLCIGICNDMITKGGGRKNAAPSFALKIAKLNVSLKFLKNYIYFEDILAGEKTD